MPISFTPFPSLATNRLLLRKLVPEDASDIFMIRSDDNVNHFLERAKANSIDDARHFIKKVTDNIENNESVYWAIILKNENKLIGTICLWNIDAKELKAEIGYELLPAFQGNGYMQEALSEVIHYVSSNLHINILEACTHKSNQASLNLLEKNEFKRDLPAEASAKDIPLEMVIYSRSLD